MSSQAAKSEAALPVLLTVAEVAEVLRTTSKAVYTMVERAQLPGVTRIGRRVLVRRDRLFEWLAACSDGRARATRAADQV